MTVDIKTLRVGSHVNLCGKRQHIMTIDALNGAIGMCGYLTDENGVKHPLGYKVDDIEPIPITPDLLKELGLINMSGRRIVYTNGNEDDNPWIEFKNLKDRWELFVCNNGWQGQTVVRYLHEAEAFLALHGVELINE